MTEKIAGKIFKGEAINSFFILLTKPVILTTSLLVAGFFSLYEYGTYKLLMSFYALISGFSVNFLDNLILNEMNIFHGNQEEDKSKKIFREYFFLKVGVGFFLLVSVFLLSEGIARYYSGDIGQWVKIVTFLFLIENLKNVILIFFQYKLKFFLSSLYVFSLELIKLLLIIGAHFFFVFGIRELLWIIVIANLSVVLLSFPFLLVGIKKNSGNDTCFIRESLLLKTIVLHGKWVIIRSYFINFVQNIRPWLIKYFLGVEAVALFSIAVDFVDNLKSIISFNSIKVFLPRKMNDPESMRKIYVKGSKYITYIFVLLGIVGIIAIPIIIKIFIPKYIDSLPYFFIMILSLLFFGVSTMANKVLYSLRKQKELLYLSFWNAFFIVVFNMIFVPILGLGLWGFSLEFLINQVCIAVLSYIFVVRFRPELKFSYKDFFLDKNDRSFLKKIPRVLYEKISN